MGSSCPGEYKSNLMQEAGQKTTSLRTFISEKCMLYALGGGNDYKNITVTAHKSLIQATGEYRSSYTRMKTTLS